MVTRGTASTAFCGFGPSLNNVGGKTGTGQTIANNDNHAWFAGVGPIDSPRWVVVVLIDEGGSGGQVAAPVARHIMQYLMGESPDPDRRGRGGGLMTLLAHPDAPPAISDRRRNTPDRVLFITTLALSLLGLLMIYSATRVGLERDNLPASFSMERQMIFVAAG